MISNNIRIDIWDYKSTNGTFFVYPVRTPIRTLRRFQFAHFAPFSNCYPKWIDAFFDTCCCSNHQHQHPTVFFFFFFCPFMNHPPPLDLSANSFFCHDRSCSTLPQLSNDDCSNKLKATEKKLMNFYCKTSCIFFLFFFCYQFRFQLSCLHFERRSFIHG